MSSGACQTVRAAGSVNARKSASRGAAMTAEMQELEAGAAPVTAASSLLGAVGASTGRADAGAAGGRSAGPVFRHPYWQTNPAHLPLVQSATVKHGLPAAPWAQIPRPGGPAGLHTPLQQTPDAPVEQLWLNPAHCVGIPHTPPRHSPSAPPLVLQVVSLSGRLAQAPRLHVWQELQAGLHVFFRFFFFLAMVSTGRSAAGTRPRPAAPRPVSTPRRVCP
jgi:hypothetical protein